MSTIKDIAKYAGVSVTTVSRAFNNRGYISEKTRKKIDEACEVLNYQPNEVARTLFRKKSNIIGVMIPRLDSFFFSEFTQLIENELYKFGFKMMLCATNGDPDKEKSYFNTFQAHKVDGVIISSYLSQESFDYSSLPMPAVAFDRILSNGIPCIGSDHKQIGTLATHELLSSGCKKLVHISGDSRISSPAHDKTLAFKHICKEYCIENLVIEKNMIKPSRDHSDGEVFSLADTSAVHKKHLLDLFETAFEQLPNFDGIFLSDEDACEFLKYAMSRGISIPKDIKVVGYDNLRISTMVYPSLSTISQDLNAIANQLVKCLAISIDSKQTSTDDNKRISVPVHLVRRDTSTGDDDLS